MRPDFSQMTVDEVRKLYCEKSGKTMEEALQLKPKSKVVESLLEFYPKNEGVAMNFDEIQLDHTPMSDVPALVLDDETTPPEKGSEGWQEYVMSLLREDEYVLKDGNKYPKSFGLRRLVEKLLGPIVFSGPIQTTSPSNANGLLATVVYRVVVLFREHHMEQREFSDIADAGPLNCPDEYSRHPSATASSRAAGRAYRSALLLSVHTAEEMSHESKSVTNGPTDDIRILDSHLPITTAQIVGIKTITDRLKINIEALLSHHGLNSNMEVLTKENGLNILTVLNKYSSKDLEIPDNIKVAG